MESEQEELGYVLHQRHLSDSKRIFLLFTSATGFVSVVHRVKKNRSLKAFQPYSLSWRGVQELKTLLYAEPSGRAITLNAKPLFCGLYLNELLTRTLSSQQGYVGLYESYVKSLLSLSTISDQDQLIEVILRRFEFALLSELGFGISLEHCENGVPIENSVDRSYIYLSDGGFAECAPSKQGGGIFNGADIHNIFHENWDERSLKSAKRLARLALAPLLGNKPLKSRDLFQ